MGLQEDAQRKDAGHPLAPFPSRISGAPTMWGTVEDYPFWNAVVSLYDEDKLSGAYQMAEALGDGRSGRGLFVYRLIEAEYALRHKGLCRDITPHLTIEYIPGEQEQRIEWLTEATLHVIQEMRKRVNWKGQEKVWVSILPEQYDSEFASNRFGYCTQKSEFYKICLPASAAAHPVRFGLTLAHELAHVVSLSVSEQRLTKWLGEGFSVYLSGETDNRSRAAFLSNPELWLPANQLELQFGPGVDLNSRPKWLAYQQAGWVVRYAAKLKGIESVMQLLEEHRDESFWRNVKLLALGRTRTADAVQAVYGVTEHELMRRAYRELRSP